MISYSTVSLLVLLYSLHFAYMSSSEELVWIGGVTATSFIIHLDVAPQISAVLLSSQSNFDQIVARFGPDSADAVLGDTNIYGRLRKFVFTNLTSSTLYYVGLQDSTTDSIQNLTSVRTFPSINQSTDVTFAFGSCLYFRSWSDAVESIEKVHKDHISRRPDVPFLLIQTGDLAYSDLSVNDVARYEASIRSVVTYPRINPVFRAMPVVYMYDDHDYGADNSDYTSPSRDAAVSNYRTMVPTYPLASSSASYFAFTIGRIRVIVTDLVANSGRDAESNLGLDQRRWFLDQLTNASSYDLVVWVSTKPWIGATRPGATGWYAYPEERTLISNYLVENNIDNLVMISGDAHMVAADNGTHSDYSSNGGAGFPVFQSAPLGNVGTTKGGPYSEGCHAYRFFRTQQFALLHVTVENSGATNATGEVCVEYSAYAAKRETPLINWKKCGKIAGVVGQGGDATTCSIPWLPPWMWFVVALVILWIIIMCSNCVLCIRVLRFRRRKRFDRDRGNLQNVAPPQ